MGDEVAFEVDYVELEKIDGRKIPSALSINGTQQRTSLLAIEFLYRELRKSRPEGKLSRLDYGEVINLPTVMAMARAVKENPGVDPTRAFKKTAFFRSAQVLADRLGFKVSSVEIIGGVTSTLGKYTERAKPWQQEVEISNLRNPDSQLQPTDQVLHGFDVIIGLEPK